MARKAVGLVIGHDANGKVIQTGSGFFISDAGEFVTNEHVIHGTEKVTVKTENGAHYIVKKILADSAALDLAILQVAARDVSYLTLETSGMPEVGSRIAVIGSPLELEGTLSDGIVSAIRTEDSGAWIQITAPISPGSSGSPVLNGQGQVVGVVTLGSNGKIQNLNFARSSFDVLLLHQNISGAKLTGATRIPFVPEKTPGSRAEISPAASSTPSPASSTPSLTLAQSPTPSEMLLPSPSPGSTAESPSPTPRQTYRVAGLPRSTPFLNIRAGAGANFAVVGIFTAKGRGIVLGPGRIANGQTIWQEVFSGEFHGWVNSQYLAPETSDTRPAADELATPKRAANKRSGGHN